MANANTRKQANTAKAPAAKAPAAAPAAAKAEPVNQWARELARSNDPTAYPAAVRRYYALAFALAALADKAKAGDVVAVRYAQVNALTGSKRGTREGCDEGAQWVRGLRRLHDVHGAAGLRAMGLAEVAHDPANGRVLLTRA